MCNILTPPVILCYGDEFSMNLEKGNPSKTLVPKGVKAQIGINSSTINYSISMQTSDEKGILGHPVSNDSIDQFL